MKSLEIQVKKRLLIVEDAEHGSFFPPKWSNYKLEKEGEIWKPICRGSDLSEEIAKGLAVNIAGFNNFYCCHHDSDLFLASPIKSFISAIELRDWYWGRNPLADEICAPDIDEWKGYESRTFHPEKCLIFEIVEGQS